MSVRKEILNFTVTNSSNSAIPVSLFGNPANLADNSNATTVYAWDVTSLVLTNENTIELQYGMASALTLGTITVNFSGTTRQDVVNALNTLGLGGFGLLDTGLNWYIFNYNDTFQFGYLNIYNPTVVPTTFAGNLTGVGNTFTFLINAVPQVTFTNPPALISGTYNAAVGDNLQISGNSGAGGNFNLWIYQEPEHILLTAINIIPPATPFVFNWVALSTKNYSVQCFP